MTLGTKFESWEWGNFSKYQCILNYNAVIDTRGCNTGTACDGSIQMYRVAKAFLGNKPGKILAPPGYAIAIARPEAVFSNDKILNYKNDSDFTFTDSGTGANLDRTIAGQCYAQLLNLNKRVNELNTEFNNEHCQAKIPQSLMCIGNCVETLKNQKIKINNLLKIVDGRSLVKVVSALESPQLQKDLTLENLEKSLDLTESQAIHYCSSKLSKSGLKNFFDDKVLGKPQFVPMNIFPSNGAR